MAEYLSPSIEMVMPRLEQACDDLIRQSLVRALTEYTKELCESDPELADILLEGTKTLPRCIRYVLELGAVALPKTAVPAHMEANCQLDFMISKEDMEMMKSLVLMKDYGEFTRFPVFSGK